MKNLLIGLLLSITISNSYGQYQKGGVMVVGGVAVMQLDTNARQVIKIIEDERFSEGGSLFSTAEKQYVNLTITCLKSIGVWNRYRN